MQLNEKITKDDRLTALREYLVDEEKATEEELAEITPAYKDEEFETPYGDYLVLTEDEASDLALEEVKALLEEEGVDILNTDNIDIDSFVEEDWFRDALEESNQYYAEDILSESDDTYDNRLVEECYSNDLISDDDFELDEDGEIDYTKCQLDSDELIEMYVEYLNNLIRDPIREFIDNFGSEEFNRAVKEYGLVDMDALAKEVINLDGRGPTLASYDGEEREIESNGEWFYIYRTN